MEIVHQHLKDVTIGARQLEKVAMDAGLLEALKDLTLFPTPTPGDQRGPTALEVMQRLDGVFGIEMAYIAAWHQAPVRQGRDLLRLHWQITSVRRAPGKLKYLAGSESAMGAFVADVAPEAVAQLIRENL